jgi:Flp pilus assembly protein TadB
MRLGWAIVAGLAVGTAAWWWTTREEREHARVERERQAAIEAEAARPVLYRWRDANGVLQITEKPPKGRRYERVEREPSEGIEVHGDRGADLPETPR